MYILGLNAFHADSSACLLKDGVLIAAIEEERIRRVKHWAGFPSEAIRFCLREAGISVNDIDEIAISRDPSANLLNKVTFSLRNRVSLASIRDRMKNRGKITGVKAMLAKEFGVEESALKARLCNVEHHHAHMASAFFASPFQTAAILSIDGFGDFTSTMTGWGENEKITKLSRVSFPHSLGIFYTAFTQFLGFHKYGDEYKIMGLAPYGNPVFTDKLREVIQPTEDGLFTLNLDYFSHHSKGVKMSWEGGEPEIGIIYSSRMAEKFGKPREKQEELTQYHKDLAASVQKMTEDVIFHILNHLHKRTGSDNLCLAGGVAQNSVANGKIILNTPFRHLYVPPAGHDAGTAIGAALYLHNHVRGNKRTAAMQTGAMGSSFSNEEIEKLLKDKNIPYTKVSDDQLYQIVSDRIINRGVVGWFQGKAEFGPRALGHRSILADPRRSDAKDLLNEKIKRRESFRPFAPSILKEFADAYFEVSDNVPFMEKVFKIKEDKRNLIPAVTHVDGTGRLQTVEKNAEPRYHALIHAFYKKTNVPVLLNTSFNENEPIVNTPGEALDCYLRTNMDMLVMENIVVARNA